MRQLEWSPEDSIAGAGCVFAVVKWWLSGLQMYGVQRGEMRRVCPLPGSCQAVLYIRILLSHHRAPPQDSRSRQDCLAVDLTDASTPSNFNGWHHASVFLFPHRLSISTCRFLLLAAESRPETGAPGRSAGLLMQQHTDTLTVYIRTQR